MSDDNKVTIELDLESGEFQKKLKTGSDELSKLGADGQRSFKSVGSSALELNAILELGIKGFEAVKAIFIDTISASISAAMDEERTLVSLNRAIANSSFASR